MRCIYCNTDTDLTVSDIIPAALTKAKVRKKFVCRSHNSFTNDCYEKEMIQRLNILRNQIGLTERDGDPVRFSAELNIGEYTSEKEISISNNKSIMNSDRLYKMRDGQGRKVLVGSKENLLKKKRIEEGRILDLSQENISLSSTIDIGESFFSESTLHAVAKIAYEWHCFINNIEKLQEDKYRDIIGYILNPQQANTIIEVVNDVDVISLSDCISRTGSNVLFEYNDMDGNTYVIFFLWNIIGYKVKVCECKEKLNAFHKATVYLYHSDGTIKTKTIRGSFRVSATSPVDGLSERYEDIKNRISRLTERDLSQEYLLIFIKAISKKLRDYKMKKISIAELLDYEHEDTIIPIYVLEQIYIHRNEYRDSENFHQNVRRIFNVEDCIVLTKKIVKESLNRYLDMDCKDTFGTMVEEAIRYYRSICKVE